MGGAVLAGLRVLLVEDEMMVSLLIEDILAEQRCVIVGPYDRLTEALVAARTRVIDLAVLDVNIAGDKVYPIADVLAAREIPFLLLSGYGESAIPSEHPDWRVCGKPFREDVLIGMLVERVRSG